MKILLFLLSIISINLYPQLNKEYSPKIEEFMNIVEEKYQEMQSIQDDISLSREELDDIIKKMYDAIADDPEGYYNYIVRRYKDWEKQFKAKKINSDKPTIATIIGKFQEKISEVYSEEFATLMTIPYFLRIRILNEKENIYTDKDGNSHEILELQGEIEDIVKGEIKFSKGEIVNFIYFKHSICIHNFRRGKSYFIPLHVSNSESSNYKGLVIRCLERNSTFLIENEKIITPGNYFKIEEVNNWNEFKEKFYQKYTLQED